MYTFRKIIRERPRPAVVAAAGGAAVAVLAGVVGVAGLANARGDGGPEAAVRAFFDARRDRDCEALFDLVSETSWSRDGQLGRGGFVEECDEVVDVYRPELDSVEVVRVDDDRAVVAVSVEVEQDDVLQPGAGDGFRVHTYPGGPDTDHATASLVREQGRWKVETDLTLLRIGRSPGEVMTAYLEARATARCDDVADLVSEDAWRAAGAADRAAFVERCEAAGPDDAIGPAPAALRFELGEHDGRIAAVESAGPGNGFASATGTGSTGETFTLVADGLGWRLVREPSAIVARGLRGLVVDPPLEGYTADLDELAIPGAQDAVPLADHEGTDAVERRSESGFEGGGVVRFSRGQDSVTVQLYRFATAAGADAYAENLARRVAGNDDRRAPQAAPGVPFHTVVQCGDDPDCSRAEVAFALDTHDGYLVAAEVVDFVDPDPATTDLLARATTIVDTQIAAL